MSEKQQWLWGGAVILALITFIWWRSKDSQPESPNVENTIEEGVELENRVNQFLEDKNIVLPENAERANLKSVGGTSDSGVVTREQDANSTNITLIANLPDLETGSYQVIFSKDGEDADSMVLGTLRTAKGGYLLDYSTTDNVSDYNKVEVLNTDDESVVLEGNFVQ